MLMITQKAIRPGAILKRFVLGAHPIIQTFIERLNLREIIASHIKQDNRVKLRCERIIPILIHNILTEPKTLYEVRDWLSPLDEDSLDISPAERDLIYDDRIGRALECFCNGNHKAVFFHLALRAIKVFRLECTRLHQDTTSVTVSGVYAGWARPERLCHGHNKDHRPDLKQLVLGTTVTADGAVPLAHKIYSGNQTDDQLHVQNHRRLRMLLRRSDFIYVADCKLATDSNLAEIVACQGRFVSVMPRTWKEDELFRQQVRDGKVKWKLILSRPNNRKPDSKRDRYYLAAGSYQTSQGYALLWIRSTQKAETDLATREKHIQGALDDLRDLQTRINRYYLKTKDAIRQAYQKILVKHEAKKWLTVEVHCHRSSRVKYGKPGRPKAGVKGGKRVWEEYFSLSFSVNQDAVKQAAMTDGVFPLITNIEKDYTPKQILEFYKYQPFLEKRHTQYKTYQEMNRVFLKKDERVIGALHVHVMALMVATLIERQLRRGMKREQIAELPIYPEENPCPYPTMFDIARLFRGVERYVVETKDGQTIVFPPELSTAQRKVLRLMELPVSLYK
jgi:transposase